MSRSRRQFNPDTGQVFHEQQVPAALLKRKIAHEKWHRHQTPPLSFLEPPTRRRGRSKSLKAMSLRICRENIGYMEEETFQNVPTHLLWELWDHLGPDQEFLSFQTWKAFSKFLSKDREPGKPMPLRLWTYSQSIIEPRVPLATYISPISSPKLEFIAHLTITGAVSFAASELFVLPGLKNLGVLEIIQPCDSQDAATFPRITDSIVREWSTQELDRDAAFPCLRVLRIWGEDFTTYRSLAYVTKFPVLGVYDVAGGRKEDWRIADIQHEAWNPEFGSYEQVGFGLFFQICGGSLDQNGQEVAATPAIQDMVPTGETGALPSRPFASITLGHHDPAPRPSSRRSKNNTHWTFRRSQPRFQEQRQPTQVVPAVSRKRKSEDAKPHPPKSRKLQGVDALLSQFTR
ncbi:hypothetical protein SUNI508_10029 [Seiridium unicorne]|uniref:Uncharacterized protein n=1 Tax=Seiridium unicorne TaxID=138068 RepID=A0ABR2UMN6_9PEZI